MKCSTSAKTILSLLVATSLLGGCGNFPLLAGSGGVAYDWVSGPDVNVKEKSFAAADYLEQQMRSYLTRQDMIKAMPLYTPLNQEKEDVKDLAITIPYQVGTRFSQLGYKVDLLHVADEPTAGMMESSASIRDARFVLSGSFYPQTTYTHLHRAIKVSLSVTDRQTGQVIASFDYKLPQGKKVNAQPTVETDLERNDDGGFFSDMDSLIKAEKRRQSSLPMSTPPAASDTEMKEDAAPMQAAPEANKGEPIPLDLLAR